MVEQELKDIWRNSSQVEKIKIDLSNLLTDLNKRAKRLNNVIKNRDRREIIASALGAILFMYFAYEVPFIIARIGCLLTITWFVYLVYKLRNNRSLKRPIDLTQSFRQQLENQRQNMEQEAKLLNSVLYWYVLPPFIANVVFILGIGDPSISNWESGLLEYLPVTMESKLRMIGFIALFNVLIVWINKRAVKKTLKPIIDDIDRLQKQLEN
ncbi:hypothetical protein [Roseivirga sp. E12]|uniref:hypothetical protein n=1 Tax=Roseivirga sp. E12 TaxID=2819237 RepID=UPI001ABC32AD|nr:hypothetical protein [Roseivirga sp. E12]MBO3696821.1 hypothetical protein [Roseivirga sp. E12]